MGLVSGPLSLHCLGLVLTDSGYFSCAWSRLDYIAKPKCLVSGPDSFFFLECLGHECCGFDFNTRERSNSELISGSSSGLLSRRWAARWRFRFLAPLIQLAKTANVIKEILLGLNLVIEP